MVREQVTILDNKRILLGVTGSIALYKGVDLASKLTQGGALVDVIMTEAAQRFVTPLTFQGVTGRSAYTSIWGIEGMDNLPTHIAHVRLGEQAELLLIAPATANTIAKLSGGLADDLLSVTALATRCPILVAPAMDGTMYENPATQANLQTLRERGVTVIEPEVGRFASGLVGKGRLPETPTLLGAVRWALGHDGILKGRRVMVTAGGTREAIDPVRYITNRSTGKQGYALAQAAIDAGALVTLISTVDSLEIPFGATHVPVETAEQMRDAVLAHLDDTDALIMASAVADFRPEQFSTHKIKKSGDREEKLTLALTRNPDILEETKAHGEQSGCTCVRVGFAAETEGMLANAYSKLARKGLDLIVANDITRADTGFGADTNRVVLLDQQGNQQNVELMSKAKISEAIIKRVCEIYRGKEEACRQ